MIEERYAGNIYFLVVFDINVGVTCSSLLAGRKSTIWSDDDKLASPKEIAVRFNLQVYVQTKLIFYVSDKVYLAHVAGNMINWSKFY